MTIPVMSSNIVIDFNYLLVSQINLMGFWGFGVIICHGDSLNLFFTLLD